MREDYHFQVRGYPVTVLFVRAGDISVSQMMLAYVIAYIYFRYKDGRCCLHPEQK
jgi:hypothetical protein